MVRLDGKFGSFGGRVWARCWLVIGLPVLGSASCALTSESPATNAGGSAGRAGSVSNGSGSSGGRESSGGAPNVEGGAPNVEGGAPNVEGGAPNVEGGAPNVSELCSPGAAVCDGQLATTCNASGDGYESGGVKCSSQQTCLDGVCQEHECEPDSTFCSDSKVLKCAADGLSSEEVAACSETQYCDSKTAACKDGACSPDQPACDGERATTCNAAGSGFLGGGSICKGNEACDVGICKPHVCQPNTATCLGQDIKRCASNGLSSAVEATCKNQACVEANEEATCQGTCAPSDKRCAGNSVQTCLAQGAWSASAACAAATPECNGAGICTERTNLLTQTEAFDNAAWQTNRLLSFGGVGSQANSGSSTAPDGSSTAELLKEDATVGGHSIEQLVNVDPTQTYTFSIYLKPAGAKAAMVYLASTADEASGVTVRVDLEQGLVGSSYANSKGTHVAHTLEALADGWYRASISGKATSVVGGKLRAIVYLLPTVGGDSSYQGVTSSAVLVWGAQLEKGAMQTFYRAN